MLNDPKRPVHRTEKQEFQYLRGYLKQMNLKYLKDKAAWLEKKNQRELYGEEVPGKYQDLLEKNRVEMTRMSSDDDYGEEDHSGKDPNDPDYNSMLDHT